MLSGPSLPLKTIHQIWRRCPDRKRTFSRLEASWPPHIASDRSRSDLTNFFNPGCDLLQPSGHPSLLSDAGRKHLLFDILDLDYDEDFITPKSLSLLAPVLAGDPTLPCRDVFQVNCHACSPAVHLPPSSGQGGGFTRGVGREVAY